MSQFLHFGGMRNGWQTVVVCVLECVLECGWSVCWSVCWSVYWSVVECVLECVLACGWSAVECDGVRVECGGPADDVMALQ